MSQKLCKPVFIGKKWTLEVAKLASGKVAGYVTAHTAQTVAVNDPSYPSAPNFKVPKTVMHKLKVLMRKHGWVEDVYAYLKPDYIREIVAKGDGRKVPVEYADTKFARLYYRGDINHAMFVEHYSIQKHAYDLWLALPKGVRCAMRNAGEKTPVYSHDLVDRM